MTWNGGNAIGNLARRSVVSTIEQNLLQGHLIYRGVELASISASKEPSYRVDGSPQDLNTTTRPKEKCIGMHKLSQSE